MLWSSAFLMVQLSQGAPTSVHLGAIWIDRDSLQSLCPAMAVLRGVCHMQSQSIWGLYHLNPHCFISDSTKVFNFLDYIWDWTFWILWRLNSLHSLVGMSPAFCWFESLLRSLSAEQKKKKRHRFIEQSFRLCGRRRGWDVSREQHRNMYII